MVDPIAVALTGMFAEEVSEVEKKVKDTALDFVKQNIIDQHIEQVLKVREQYPLPLGNIEVLSSNISLNQNVPAEIKRQIGAFQAKLRAVINRAATEIENYGYRSSEEAISKMRLSYNERTQVSALLDGDKKVNISFQSLKVATELFSRLNDYVIQKIEECEKVEDSRLERELILANAVLVYELSDFLISYLETFQLEGSEEIAKTQQYMNNKLTQLEREEQELKSRTESDEINDSQVKQQVLADIANREQAIQMVREEWNKYADSIEDLKSNLGATKKDVPTLKLIRDNAKSQINVLEAAAVMQIVKSNVKALQSAILTLKQIKLVSLTPARVTRLLNIS